jgi:hypothetical protein
MANGVVLTEPEALKLVAYLTASADISLFEPDLYGPFRLIDAAGQLAGYVLAHDPGSRRAFWQEIKTEIEQKKVWLMWDRPGFRQFLAHMPARIVAEQAQIQGRNEVIESGAISKSEVLALLAYLTASADISLFEPELYPPFRLIDAAGQLAGLVLTQRLGGRREQFWQTLKVEIDQKKGWLMWDRPSFRAFLSQLPAKVATALREA